jgi:hypothetical protein
MKQKLKQAAKRLIGQQNIDRLMGHRNEERDLAGLDEADADLIRRIKAKNLTYLSNRKLAHLTTTLRQIADRGLDGVLLETGCALGGSSILLASIKEDERALFVYDVFGMIPPPTVEDTPDVHERYKTIVQGNSPGLGGERYYGYEENLYEVVQNNFESFGISIGNQKVSLIKGLVQDTLIIDQPVALAHIDVDWYEPVKVCLERIFPRLVTGGFIVLDDYYDWGGCRKATDEFLRTIVGQFSLEDSAGSVTITKT